MGRQAKVLRGSDRLMFKSGRGYVTKLSAGRAEVCISYNVTTSMQCACEDASCERRIHIGRYGLSGDGKRSCPHCNFRKKDGNYFSGVAEFKNHLQTEKCKRSRDLALCKEEAIKIMGPSLVYEVNNPFFRVTGDGGKGNILLFNCPTCDEEVVWKNRYQHCVLCFPKQWCLLPSDAEKYVKENH